MKEGIPFISSEDRPMRCDILLTLALILPSRGPSAIPAANAPPLPTAPLAATAATPEHVTTFDNTLARVDWSPEGWRVVAGGVTLKEFGRRESDARLALRLIRELRLNQHGIIGAPAPLLEYWLSDGMPPRGPANGLHALPINAPSCASSKQRRNGCCATSSTSCSTSAATKAAPGWPWPSSTNMASPRSAPSTRPRRRWWSSSAGPTRWRPSMPRQ